MVTRELLRELRNEINKALIPFLKTHKVKMELGNASFDSAAFTFKLKGISVGKGEAGENINEMNFRKDLEVFGFFYGLDKNDYGKKFLSRNVEYTFIGIAKNRKKYPIVGKDVNGKMVLFTAIGTLDQIKSNNKGAAKIAKIKGGLTEVSPPDKYDSMRQIEIIKLVREKNGHTFRPKRDGMSKEDMINYLKTGKKVFSLKNKR